MPKRNPIDRLFAKIDVRGPDECWPWIGGMGTWGYGSFWLDGKNLNASRAVYLLLIGPLFGAQQALHSCDNPPCSNPAHLWAGTQADNVKDCNTKGRGRGLFSGKTGVKHPRYVALLTPELVREAKRLYFECGVSQSEIGRIWGVGSWVISKAVRGKSWSHLK